MINELNKYMKEKFNNIELKGALFYDAQIGIRFEIGWEGFRISDKSYIEYVYVRSIMLFEELFSKDTDIYFVVNFHEDFENIQWRDKKEELKNNLKKYFNNKMVGNKIEFIKIPYIYYDDASDDDMYTLRCVISCKIKDINYRKLLKAIGNHDIGIYPKFDGEVFFVDKNKDIIYYLYDDRGLDIVANKTSTLEPIYKRYNSWILDYDRHRINMIFKK